DYANTGKQITRDESTWKQMVVHAGTSSTTDDFSFRKFKKVEVEADTESKEAKSNTEGNDTSGSDSEDLDYDPKHDDVFNNDEHIVEEVHVVLHCLIMVKLNVDLNKPKDRSKTDKAALNGCTLKSLTLEIHHGEWFTPTPISSYVGGHVSSVNVIDIDEFYLHDLKDMHQSHLPNPPRFVVSTSCSGARFSEAALLGFFEKQKLTGPNFIDWYQQLRIVLSIEDKFNYLEQPIPPAPVAPAGHHIAPEILAAHNAWIKGSKEIVGLMLMTMDPEIQRNLEPLHAHEMLREQEERQSVSSYVLKMKGYTDNLDRLGHPVTLGLGGLRASRKLKSGALSLYVAMVNVGFVNRFVDNTIQVFRNNMVYFSAIQRDGIFEIDLSNSLTNESSIYVVSNKRAKLDLDPALLWHCRLGHISKKRIKKLQPDGLLDSSKLRAFEKCVSYVCGPFKIMLRQGASYFVTFTDDFSRYGYVYSLKHKHEVFETFNVFQKEVENQLGKTIKSLRSDRRGEYISQEFLDHLKDHGIISHRTPPYTPQHNGVSERRNRTLLDMVRSMMSQTTLPKSF
nr:hypothetical protein [Tanacetum cinerariifolium]